jgi:hypothetical protein
VRTGVPNNAASIESVVEFVMVGLLPQWLRVKWSLEQLELTSLGPERMTTILRFAPISEGKTWRPRSATSDLGSPVGPQVVSLRTSVKLRCWGEIIVCPGSERKVQSHTGPQGNNVFIAFPS